MMYSKSDLLTVRRDNDVSCRSNSFETSRLTDGCNLCTTKLVRSRNVVFQVDVGGQIHSSCNCLENQSLLSPRRKGEFNLCEEKWVSDEARCCQARTALTFLSSRPGLSSAGSRVSARFVAIMTLTLLP